MFKNWIESGIITVNDITNDRGEISEGLILEKLRIKTNWISEVNIIYKSFPKEWKRILHENKNKKRFNQNSEFNIYNSIDKKETNLKDVNNKTLYQILLNRVTTKSFAIDTWVHEFNLTNAQKCMNAFKFISQKIAENDERIYRLKLLHRILPNGILMHQWKILPSNVCLKCQVREDYLHYFISCTELDIFWDIILKFLAKIGYKKNMKLLEVIVLGYKTGNEAYDEINLLFSMFGFIIYKMYHRSERRFSNSLYYLKNELNNKMQIKKYKNVRIFDRLHLLCLTNTNPRTYIT